MYPTFAPSSANSVNHSRPRHIPSDTSTISIMARFLFMCCQCHNNNDPPLTTCIEPGKNCPKCSHTPTKYSGTHCCAPHYGPPRQRVTQRRNMLQRLGQEVTSDLLWALFKPNTLVYTVCTGSPVRLHVCTEQKSRRCTNLRYLTLDRLLWRVNLGVVGQIWV